MKLFRVFGNPIHQSKSPYIHQMFAKQCLIDLQYQTQLIALDGFDAAVNAFFAQGGFGINVTVPFKEQAFAMSDELSYEAKAAGAVNTLFCQQGKIIGENTDGCGLITDLINQNVKIKNKSVLLIGAGGAAKGVVLPLLQQLPSKLVITNRTTTKAEMLIGGYADAPIYAQSFAQTAEHTFDLIINATSASLNGKVPNIAESCITHHTICYDMMYGREPTAFMIWSKNAGCLHIIDGLGMLVEQAAKSFELWHAVKPNTAPVLKQLRKMLAN